MPESQCPIILYPGNERVKASLSIHRVGGGAVQFEPLDGLFFTTTKPLHARKTTTFQRATSYGKTQQAIPEPIEKQGIKHDKQQQEKTAENR